MMSEKLKEYDIAFCNHLQAMQDEVTAIARKRRTHYELLRIKDEIRALEHELFGKEELIPLR